MKLSEMFPNVCHCFHFHRLQMVVNRMATFNTLNYVPELFSVLNSENKELAIHHCHQWFHQFVEGWINIALEKAQERINNAVLMDMVINGQC